MTGFLIVDFYRIGPGKIVIGDAVTEIIGCQC